ncbi:hypothetical protein EMIHUDRAFT_237685 [Emiliania huxleyi CCMP1516]|uniref:RAP domain-containing protein n=2 Tax=Emiliania huxleyi TaxID=2903 RepID=A0A0D3JPM4_EMIH1|nr:hypothetical protein EMIHUDRAFT_237685 [Emiliania huxleyi CCMP1516]EOD25459.1 hypothetical protein EMIHUDRAFT_237685 [Emiliania huxleyi CCMP1516]|eukprot:XP_005777888.1 hypothetical protein EMIHUDRAFT_237685 [Emiliania huxleyi CCMP1516]
MRGAGSRDERHTSAASGQLNAKQLSSHISHASGADELLTLFAAHSASMDHIHAANLWNKLGKQRIERRHEGRLEQLALLADYSRVISDSLARDPWRWSEEARRQLHQWQLWLSLERGADGQQHLLSEPQRKLCCDAMQGTEVTISRLQRSVAIALAPPSSTKEEHLEPRTGYSLDLSLPSSRLAIEVDGPSHFLLPDGRGVRKPTGPTLLKQRLLRAAGWRVISVPFYEWDGFATANGQQTYLERASASAKPVCVFRAALEKKKHANSARDVTEKGKDAASLLRVSFVRNTPELLVGSLPSLCFRIESASA